MNEEQMSVGEARGIVEQWERFGRRGDDTAVRLARAVIALHERVAELEKIATGRTMPPTGAGAEAMIAAGLRLARRWHAVDRSERVVAFPEAPKDGAP